MGTLKGDDIIGNDFLKVVNDSTKALESLDTALGKVEKTQKDLVKTQTELVKAQPTSPKSIQDIEKATTATTNLNKSVKDLSKTQKEREAISKQLNASTDKEVKGKLRLQAASKAQRDALKDELILQDRNSGTLEKVAASTRKLRRERLKLNLDTKKGTDRLKAINTAIDANNQKILVNSDRLKKQRTNVGNYTQSVTEGIQASGLFSRELAILTRIQATMNVLMKKNTTETAANAAAQKGAAVASGGFSKALKILKFALIGTGIGLIVVALGSLIAAFAGTQRGADAFTKVLRPLSAIFQRFIGFLEGSAFKALDRLKEAISNPKQAFIDLANVIKDNVIARFTSFLVLGDAISLLLEGDFTGAAAKATDAAVQFSTGIENATDKVADLASETADFVAESLAQGEELDALIKKFERREIDLIVPIAKARLEFEKLRAIAFDQAKSDEERIAALNEAEKQQRFIIDNEQSLIDLQVEKLELEQSFNDTDREGEKELQTLLAERLNFENAAQKKINSLISLRSGIEKRSTAEQEKQLELAFKRRDVEAERIDNLKTGIGELTQLTGDLDVQFERGGTALGNFFRELQNGLEDFDSTVTNFLQDNPQLLAAIEEVGKAAQEASQKRVSDIDNETNERKKRQEELQKLAASGVEEAGINAAFEQRKLAELAVAKERELKKQAQREVALSAFSTFSNKVGQGESSGSALAGTIKDLTLLSQFARTIPVAFHGTDSVGSDGEKKFFNTGVDDYLYRVHEGERIVPTDINKKLGNISNDQLPNLIKYGAMPSNDVAVIGARFDSPRVLAQQFAELKNSIDNIKIPEQQSYYDAHEKAIVEVVKQGNKITRTHKRTGGIW